MSMRAAGPLTLGQPKSAGSGQIGVGDNKYPFYSRYGGKSKWENKSTLSDEVLE